MKIKDTVRVLNHPDEMLPEWVEMLQYLGVLTDLTDGGPQVLQFRCPLRLTDPEARVKWAVTVAEKMEKVGINAVPSFSWLMSDCGYGEESCQQINTWCDEHGDPHSDAVGNKS